MNVLALSIKDVKVVIKPSDIESVSKLIDNEIKANDKKTDKADGKLGMFFRIFFKLLENK